MTAVDFGAHRAFLVLSPVTHPPVCFPGPSVFSLAAVTSVCLSVCLGAYCLRSHHVAAIHRFSCHTLVRMPSARSEVTKAASSLAEETGSAKLQKT